MSDNLPETVADEPRKRNTLIIERLRAAATMLENATATDPELPEVMSVGVTGAEITIQPWLPGAPVTAMRKFEAFLEGTLDRKAFPLVLHGTEQVSLLQLGGNTGSHPVVVTVSTHRDTPVDGFLGVAEQTVAELADAETPAVFPDGERYELVAQSLQALGTEPAEQEKEDDA